MTAPFDLNIQSGLCPPGPARLIGGPMDGTFIPAVHMTQWLGVSFPGSEVVEWYCGMARDKHKVCIYTHLTVNDRELDWPTILGYDPDDVDDDDDDGPDLVYTGP